MGTRLVSDREPFDLISVHLIAGELHECCSWTSIFVS